MLNKNEKKIKINAKPLPALRLQGAIFFKNFKNYLS